MGQVAIPATLFRRLAEVIDGSRTGRYTWFALSPEFPHDPFTSTAGVTAFENEEQLKDAMRLESVEEATFLVFGPCRTAKEKDRLSVVAITMKHEQGEPETRKLHQDVDLICWSMSAFDKFVAPYYFNVYGRDKDAYSKVAELRRRAKEFGYFGHKWPTRPGEEDWDLFLPDVT